ECFAGYTRHLVVSRLAGILNANPMLRHAAAKLMACCARGPYQKVADVIALPGIVHRAFQDDRIGRFGDLLAPNDDGAIYDKMVRLSELSLALAQVPERVPERL